MQRDVVFPTGISNNRKASTEFLIAEMLLQLGEATWGRFLPTGQERFELIFNQGVWHLQGCRGEGDVKSFVARLQYDMDTGQTSFHIEHGGGVSTSDSLSQSELSLVLKTAYRYGPTSANLSVASLPGR